MENTKIEHTKWRTTLWELMPGGANDKMAAAEQ